MAKSVDPNETARYAEPSNLDLRICFVCKAIYFYFFVLSAGLQWLKTTDTLSRGNSVKIVFVPDTQGNAQSVWINIILRMRKVSSWPLLSHTQSDQDLCWSHIPDVTFSNGAGNFIVNILAF